MSEPTSGDPRSPAMMKLRLEHWVRARAQVVLVPLARISERLGLTPNMLTLIGLALNALVAVVLARGSIFVGGVLLLFASSFDAMDGTLARVTRRQSRFGAFFDSTIDRYSAAVVYGGLLVYHIDVNARTETLMVYAAIIGSLMVSYARARAEGLDIECRVGMLTRADRMVVLAVGLVLGWVKPALWFVAVFANLTAAQRILHVRREAAAAEGGAV